MHRQTEQSVLLVDYENKSNTYTVLDRSCVSNSINANVLFQCGSVRDDSTNNPPSSTSPEPDSLQFLRNQHLNQQQFLHRRCYPPCFRNAFNRNGDADNQNESCNQITNYLSKSYDIPQTPCDVVPFIDHILFQKQRYNSFSEVTDNFPSLVSSSTTIQNTSSVTTNRSITPLSSGFLSSLRQGAFKYSGSSACSVCLTSSSTDVLALPLNNSQASTEHSQDKKSNSMEMETYKISTRNEDVNPMRKWLALPCNGQGTNFIAMTSRNSVIFLNGKNLHSDSNNNDFITKNEAANENFSYQFDNENKNIVTSVASDKNNNTQKQFNI